jgi:peptidoglycan L-alanyl-D-glutamate endopeptidase CwlK
MDSLGILLILGLAYLASKSTESTSNNSENSVAQINSRLLSQVNPVLAEKAQTVINQMANLGNTLIVAEGYRTNALQDKYYAQGRTTPGNIITYKKGGESKHNVGKAVDFDFIIDGKQSNSNSNNWTLLGKIAKSAGLIWGGDFKNLRDYRHVEI